MSISDSKLLIRDYADIRDILRDIYIYGCFSRDDFISKGISGRKYDNEQRRIASYLPSKFIKKKRDGKRVLPYCSYDMTETLENFIAETYRNKSFTILDAMSYFFILSVLENKQDITLSEILEIIPEENDKIIYTKDNLRKKLEELTEKGLIKTKRKGRKVLYEITDDYFAAFEDSELIDLYWLLEFVKNVSPIEMPYFFLQRKLKLYLSVERNVELSDITSFQYKHNHLFNVLDNDVAIEILKSIHSRRSLTLSRRFRGEERVSTVVPLKIIHECIYGRQYMLYFDLVYEMIKTCRIDRIVSATAAEVVDDSVFCKAVKSAETEKSSWCTSGLGTEPATVVIEFYIDEQKEQYVLDRIRREGKDGKIEKIHDGLYHFSVSVNDPLEMTPWIRSFGERAKVIQSKNGVLENHLIQDYERAIAKYEAI